MTTLVVGATGLLGRRICRRLLDHNERVRALVRDGSPGADALRALRLEPVQGDLKDPTSLDRACYGIHTVVTTANAVSTRLPRDNFISVDRDGQLALVRSARAANVRRFVYVSLSPALPPNNLFVQCKREMERAVRASGMEWTILQPAAFMEVHLGAPLGWDYAKGRALILGSTNLVKSYISADDVAEFAAGAVELPSAANRALHLTGPEPLTAADAVSIAERATGRPFKVRRIPGPALRVLSAVARPFVQGSRLKAQGFGPQSQQPTTTACIAISASRLILAGMRKPTLIVLLAASALVTACGGASTDTSNAPAQPAQAPAASTPAPEPAAQPTAQPEMRLETAAAAPTPAPDTSAAKAPAPGVRRAAPPPAPPPEHPTFTQTDLEQGTGAAAAQGKRLTVNYTGWLYDPAEPEQKGRQFDSSVGGQPFEFVLGARRVIRGWDQGFDGMNVGGKRRLVIPPELGYGERGFGNGVIPPNAALVFEMELMEVGE